MADYVIVTYDHQADHTDLEVFAGDLVSAQLAVIDRSNALIHEHPSWELRATQPLDSGVWRSVSVVDRRAPGMTRMTFRINDWARHCRTCRCHVSAFA